MNAESTLLKCMQMGIFIKMHFQIFQKEKKTFTAHLSLPGTNHEVIFVMEI